MKNFRADTAGLLKRYNGFSLIELVVVVALIGILLATALPSFMSWRDRLAYRQSGRDISSLIRQAKSIAIETNRQQQIVLDVALRQYRLQQGNRPVLSTVWNPSTRIVNTTTLPPDMGISPLGTTNIATQYPIIQINPIGSMFFTNAANTTDTAMHIDIMDNKVIPPVARYRIDLTQTGRITGNSQ